MRKIPIRRLPKFVGTFINMDIHIAEAIEVSNNCPKSHSRLRFNCFRRRSSGNHVAEFVRIQGVSRGPSKVSRLPLRDLKQSLGEFFRKPLV